MGSLGAVQPLDAFRFFTEQARPLNQFQPTRTSQVDLDQPGCLHANMDVYKWAGKLLPAVDSALLLDSFELAREIRELDMRASAYDLSQWGYPPVPVETSRGEPTCGPSAASASGRRVCEPGPLRVIDALIEQPTEERH